MIFSGRAMFKLRRASANEPPTLLPDPAGDRATREGWLVIPAPIGGNRFPRRAPHQGQAREAGVVAAGKRSFSQAGAGKLKIKLTPGGKRLLKHATSIRLTANASYPPPASRA